MKKSHCFSTVAFVLEAWAGVEPTYTDLQRLGGLNYLYKSIAYKSKDVCATICAIKSKLQALLK
jgi:hypothetical protein